MVRFWISSGRPGEEGKIKVYTVIITEPAESQADTSKIKQGISGYSFINLTFSFMNIHAYFIPL